MKLEAWEEETRAGQRKKEGGRNKRRGLANLHLKDSRPAKLSCTEAVICLSWLRE